MVWRVLTKRVEPRALRGMNGRGRVGMKGRPAGWKAGPEHCGEPSPADCERYKQRRARAASACGERVYAASACGERRGLRGTLVSGRASGRATAERYLDEGGFWLDLADLACAAKDRRGGEMRGENYRSTAQQVGCERRVLTGHLAERRNRLHHTPRGERTGWLWQAGAAQIALPFLPRHIQRINKKVTDYVKTSGHQMRCAQPRPTSWNN